MKTIERRIQQLEKRTGGNGPIMPDRIYITSLVADGEPPEPPAFAWLFGAPCGTSQVSREEGETTEGFKARIDAIFETDGDDNLGD